MSLPLYVSLYSTWACQSPTLLGRVPVVHEPGACVVTDAIDGVLATSKVALRIPDGWSGVDDLTVGRIIRLTYIDNSTAAGAFDEFRIHDVQRVTGDASGRLTLTGFGPLYEFGIKRLLLQTQLSGSPTSCLTTIVASGPTIFSVGTVTPTAGVDLDLQGVMPIAALQQLGALVNSLADVDAGVHYAFQARRNGVTDYKLDLINVGSSATVPDVRAKKNLRSLVTRTTLQDAPTRLYITAQGQPVYDAWWEITDVQAGYIVIAGIGGDTSLNPIAADDALVTDCEGNALTTHWVREDGTAYALTGTVRATRRLEMASTTGLAVGQWGRLAKNSAGAPLDRLDLPNTEAVVGTLDVPWAAGTNLVPNARFETWSAGDPTGWDNTGTAFTEENSAGLFGGTGAVTPSAATGSLYPHGGRWTSGTQSRQLRAGDQVTYGLWLKLVDMAGQHATFVYNDVDGVQQNVNLGPGGSAEFYPHDATVTDGKFFEVIRGFTAPVAASYSLRWQYVHNSTLSDAIVCGARVTVTPAGLTPPTGFFENSTGAKAIVRGVNYLLSRQNSPSVYDVSLLDLTAHDGTTWPWDALTLGGSLRLTSDLSGASETLRVMQVDRDLLFPLDNTRVVLASRWQTLTSQLFGAIVKPTRVTIGTPVNLTPTEPPPPLPPGAPNDAPYALVHSFPGLGNARELQASGSVSLVDAGPGASLTIVGGVSELIEVSSSVNLAETVDTGLKTWDPVPFDTIDHQTGSGLTLESDGSITVAVGGLYAYELQADFNPQTVPGAITYYVGSLYAYDDPWDNQDMGTEEIIWSAGMDTGWRNQTKHISGVLRVADGDAVKFGIISRRSPSGDHLVSNPLAKLWKIGDL